MKKESIVIGILSLTLLFTSACSGNRQNHTTEKEIHPVNYTTTSGSSISWGCDVDTVSDTLKYEADSTETKDGCTGYIYKECVLENYTGEMTYYFAENQLALSRWEYLSNDLKDARKAYSELKKQLTEENGKGTETDTSDTCQWESKNRNITLGYAATKEGGQVYLIEYQ